MWTLSVKRPRRKIALKANPHRKKRILLKEGIKKAETWSVKEHHLHTRSKARVQLSPRRLVRSRRREDNYSIKVVDIWDRAVLVVEDLKSIAASQLIREKALPLLPDLTEMLCAYVDEYSTRTYLMEERAKSWIPSLAQDMIWGRNDRPTRRLRHYQRISIMERSHCRSFQRFSIR
jgi:hypothetical protein